MTTVKSSHTTKTWKTNHSVSYKQGNVFTKELRNQVSNRINQSQFSPTSRKTKKVISYINDVHICKILREAASDLYKISSKEDLAKFTAHSIRVGACVLLHSQNVSAEDIKFRLRWRSDSFRMYLRNIIQLAMKHTDVINKA